MTHTPPPSDAPKPSHHDALDFELVDFDEARRALEELPAGITQCSRLDPGYWQRIRRPMQPSDKAMTGSAMGWVIHLPPHLRPNLLCHNFPRVANLLATAWADKAARTALLKGLLEDRRGGGRTGFAQPIQKELRALLDAPTAQENAS